jgi:hypothetical protein
MPVCRWYIALVTISSALWISSAQAFFCFSMGNGSRQREDHYLLPPPIGAYSYGDFPPPYYASPVMPQWAIAPGEIRDADDPALDPPVAPVELPDDDYPVPAGPVPKQHIFH